MFEWENCRACNVNPTTSRRCLHQGNDTAYLTTPTEALLIFQVPDLTDRWPQTKQSQTASPTFGRSLIPSILYASGKSLILAKRCLFKSASCRLRDQIFWTLYSKRPPQPVKVPHVISVLSNVRRKGLQFSVLNPTAIATASSPPSPVPGQSRIFSRLWTLPVKFSHHDRCDGPNAARPSWTVGKGEEVRSPTETLGRIWSVCPRVGAYSPSQLGMWHRRRRDAQESCIAWFVSRCLTP